MSAENKYTPNTIDRLFTIPLYQRLFEWEEPQIVQLLNDLYAGFKKDRQAPYYIGMLTTYKSANEERYSLVDGQQRFTVLNLLGIAFEWPVFLQKDNQLRLSFFARKNDEQYLQHLIEGSECKYVNLKMQKGLGYIEQYLKNNIAAEETAAFKSYVFEQTTFFISELPESYSLQDLNRYFEAMNEAGKGLENHEILKVELLKQVDEINYGKYTTIWNEVAEMDKCIVKQMPQEKQEDYKQRTIAILQNISFEKVFGNKEVDGNANTTNALKDVVASSKKPQELRKERTEQAMLSFTEFLLQVLWLSLDKDKRTSATEFFNSTKLLETFDKHITTGKTVNVNSFFENLLQYRLLYDYYIIRLNSSQEQSLTYSVNQIADSSDDAKRNLIQYQSMLYVSTPTHVWLTDFLSEVKYNTTIEQSLKLLTIKDNERHASFNDKNDVPLKYGSINRYWFWRLDYYLWLKRNKYFEDERSRQIAGNYVFRANRSIEHIAPQQPKRQTKATITENLRDEFGNLAMISAGQNSSLQNESFEVKRAYVESFINDGVGGSIQSLKMLKIYKYGTWNDANLKEHHNEMIEVLMDSFEDKEKYATIIEKLSKQLKDIGL